jgi:hypothetical protein
MATSASAASLKPPSTIDEYIAWLESSHRVTVGDRESEYHDLVVHRIKRTFETSPFWTEFLSLLPTYEGEYRLATGYPLFLAGTEPTLVVKGFSSFLLKTFRKNILENPTFPNPAEDWLLPDNWYQRTNDLVRTYVAVKYLDGVTFLMEHMRELATKHSLPHLDEMQARMEGYYAGHFYVRPTVEIPKMTWDTVTSEFSIEIQVTTQLQEVMRQLLHRYYEEHRGIPRAERRDWQWEYRSEEFSANYLGHILHYVEGMIMEVRERDRARKEEEKE